MKPYFRPPLYTRLKPCLTCPYRKDSRLAFWSVEEFRALVKSEQDQLGCIWHCHKKDGTVCIGWLMDQDDRRFPSIMLRLSLSRNNVTRDYLDRLTCPSPRYTSVLEMARANYPDKFSNQ